MELRTGIIAAALAFGLAQSAKAVEPVHFAPHRAVYDIVLTKAATGSGVAELDGRMVYELTGSACEGYTQNMRFVTRMTNDDGAETINDLRNSSWEDAAGKRLRFSSTQYVDDKVIEASQGDARRSRAGAPVTVDLQRPGKSHLELPASTLFPMQHSKDLLEAAKAGRRFVSRSLFDGSEKGNKIYLTSAVIGKPAPPGASTNLAALKDASRLATLESWPVSLSYFEAGKDHQDTPPIYELSYRFYENGVSADLVIDYGEFAVEGKLKDLTFLPESSCATDEH